MQRALSPLPVPGFRLNTVHVDKCPWRAVDGCEEILAYDLHRVFLELLFSLAVLEFCAVFDDLALDLFLDLNEVIFIGNAGEY